MVVKTCSWFQLLSVRGEKKKKEDGKGRLHYQCKGSFTFNSTVYIADKHHGSAETNRTEHQEECIGHASTVTKKEEQLHEAVHIRLQIEVNPITKHENSSRSTAQHASAGQHEVQIC